MAAIESDRTRLARLNGSDQVEHSNLRVQCEVRLNSCWSEGGLARPQNLKMS